MLSQRLYGFTFVVVADSADNTHRLLQVCSYYPLVIVYTEHYSDTPQVNLSHSPYW